MTELYSQNQTGIPAPAPALARRQKAYEYRRNAGSIKKHGCGWTEYLLIRDHPSIPKQIFKRHRYNALARGVGWELTLWQWWSAWQQSGRWDERGPRRHEYCMCRLNDVGPYAVDNIYIATNRDNMLDYWVNRRHAASLQAAVPS